ncbi:MAG: 3-keto-5-aminohexanoate cleavage protein [Candidatus Lokiarchaeota archaeon]|nr:3-keto-5-aminohexanoate cleavage protein [Candidatus Lokiarchaeota archaeon]
MEKLIITAAICGAEVTKEQNPNVPYTVEEIGIQAESAYWAGASIIHLHVRYDDGTPTQDKERFRECFEEIRSRCPEAIILPSTGGAIGMTAEERLQPIYLDPTPEIATLDCGTVNFGGDEIFVNTESMIVEFAEKMKELEIKPELEIFDKGMIDTINRLHKKGYIKHPMHFNLVLGVLGGIAATTENLVFLLNSLPKESTYTVTAIGRYQFPMIAQSIAMGGHARVGFEDNLYISKGILAKSNGELVNKVVKISEIMGREIADPNETRRLLQLKKG